MCSILILSASGYEQTMESIALVIFAGIWQTT